MQKAHFRGLGHLLAAASRRVVPRTVAAGYGEKIMIRRQRWVSVVILLAVLNSLPASQAGAQGAGGAACPGGRGCSPRACDGGVRGIFRKLFGRARGATVPGTPLPRDPKGGAGGFMLRTGGIQLGPGVGKNLIRWQGDGYSGF